MKEKLSQYIIKKFRTEFENQYLELHQQNTLTDIGKLLYNSFIIFVIGYFILNDVNKELLSYRMEMLKRRKD